MLHVVECHGHVSHGSRENLSIMLRLFSEAPITAPIKNGQEALRMSCLIS